MSNWATNWLISWTNRRPVGTSVIISWQQKQINCHSGRDKDKERERGERKSYLHSQTSPLLKTNICGQKRIRHKVNICRKRQQELQDLSMKSGHPFYTPRHLIRQRVNRQPARWTPSRAKLEPLNRWTIPGSVSALTICTIVAQFIVAAREGRQLGRGHEQEQLNWLRCKRTTSDYNFICKCFLRISRINTKIHSQHTCPHPSPYPSGPVVGLVFGFWVWVRVCFVCFANGGANWATRHSPHLVLARPAHICQLQWSVEWKFIFCYSPAPPATHSPPLE